ncbi:MAG: IS110 family transposase [Desulfuromonadales bacterium]|nr:MAG: IS110 family transposase [Desulfuromonadales bacterium]
MPSFSEFSTGFPELQRWTCQAGDTKSAQRLLICQLRSGLVNWLTASPSAPLASPSAPLVLAAIGNAFRFENRKQVLRLAGLDLSAERSGKNSDSAKPVISKQGKAALRYALVQAAMVASTSNPTIRTYFSRLLQGRELERGINLKMKVKLAAKLLVIAWTLMKSKERFKPSCFSG